MLDPNEETVEETEETEGSGTIWDDDERVGDIPREELDLEEEGDSAPLDGYLNWYPSLGEDDDILFGNNR
jgi:hypothetical protein